MLWPATSVEVLKTLWSTVKLDSAVLGCRSDSAMPAIASVCVCVCARACVRVCVRACVRVCFLWLSCEKIVSWSQENVVTSVSQL